MGPRNLIETALFEIGHNAESDLAAAMTDLLEFGYVLDHCMSLPRFDAHRLLPARHINSRKGVPIS